MRALCENITKKIEKVKKTKQSNKTHKEIGKGIVYN